MEQDGGRISNDDIIALASEWIAGNRDLVDAWLHEAAAAGRSQRAPP
jgi:ABC-type proline/glycine betaine transport system substrate-binding protein